MTRSLPILRIIAAAAALCALADASAYVVNIGTGTRAIYLQVGNGSFTGTYSGGGTPGSNATVNQVTVTVPAAQVGTGTAQQMSSNTTPPPTFHTNFPLSTPPPPTNSP